MPSSIVEGMKIFINCIDVCYNIICKLYHCFTISCEVYLFGSFFYYRSSGDRLLLRLTEGLNILGTRFIDYGMTLSLNFMGTDMHFNRHE